MYKLSIIVARAILGLLIVVGLSINCSCANDTSSTWEPEEPEPYSNGDLCDMLAGTWCSRYDSCDLDPDNYWVCFGDAYDQCCRDSYTCSHDSGFNDVQVFFCSTTLRYAECGEIPDICEDMNLERIRRLRETRGMSLRQLAMAAGFESHGALSRIETGSRALLVERLLQIASALGVEPAEILK